MNVFETVKRLLTEFDVYRINYEAIKPGEARKIASFNYLINNIRYSFLLHSPYLFLFPLACCSSLGFCFSTGNSSVFHSSSKSQLALKVIFLGE